MDCNVDLTSTSYRGGGHVVNEQLFACAVCGDSMVDPSTLECGHNFCRLCLARWWKACVSNHRATACPMCQQVWTTIPSINTGMRDMLEGELGEVAIARRKAVMEDSDAAELLREFDSERSKGQRRTVASAGVGRLVVFLLIGLIVIVVLLFRSGSSGARGTSDVSVQTWNVTKVQQWLSSLGDWAADYKEKFAEHKINGRLLVQLSDDELATDLAIRNRLHRRAILEETSRLHVLQSESPRDFFEYKRLHRLRAMFLLWGLKFTPRWTLIFSYFYLYDEVVVPLFKMVISHAGGDGVSELPLWMQAVMPIDKSSHTLEWAQYWVWVLAVPYILILRFAWRFIEVNLFTSCVVMSICTFLTLVEIIVLKWAVLNGGWRRLPYAIARNGVSTFAAGGIFYLLWPIIPFFVCDVAFYWFLYFGPIDAACECYRFCRAAP